jgi:tetratricopeptide (TPR) repeat protein
MQPIIRSPYFIQQLAIVLLTIPLLEQQAIGLTGRAPKSPWVKDVTLGERALAENNLLQAESLLLAAVKEAESSTGADLRLSYTLRELAIVESKEGKHAAAEQCASAAVKLTDKAPFGLMLARNLRVLALVKKSAGDFSGSEACLKRALAILGKEKREFTEEKIYLLDALSEVSALSKRSSLAVQYAENLVELVDKIKDRRRKFEHEKRSAHVLLARRLVEQALAECQSKNFEESLKSLRRGLEQNVQDKELINRLELVAKCSLTELLLGKQNTPGTRTVLEQLGLLAAQQAYRMRSVLEQPPGGSMALDAINLALAEVVVHKREEAAVLLNRANNVLDSLPGSAGNGAIYFAEGAVWEVMQSFPQAVNCTTKALKLVKAHPDPVYQKQIGLWKTALERQELGAKRKAQL